MPNHMPPPPRSPARVSVTGKDKKVYVTIELGLTKVEKEVEKARKKRKGKKSVTKK